MTQKTIISLNIYNPNSQKTSFGLSNFFVNNYNQYGDYY